MPSVSDALIAAGLRTTRFFDATFNTPMTGVFSPDHNAWYDPTRAEDDPAFRRRYGMPDAGVFHPARYAAAENYLRWSQACDAAATPGGWFERHGLTFDGPLGPQEWSDLAFVMPDSPARAMLAWFDAQSAGAADHNPPPAHPRVEPDGMLKEYSGPWWLAMTGGLDPAGAHYVYTSVSQALKVFGPDLQARTTAADYDQLDPNKSVGVLFPAKWVADHLDQLAALGAGPIATPKPVAAPPAAVTQADLDALFQRLVALLAATKSAGA